MRKRDIKETTLLHRCLDRIARQGLVCESGQCVLKPSSTTRKVVPGSTCTADGDCCPGFDNTSANKSTQAKMDKLAEKVATAIKKKCSLALGPDGVKGTDDDTFVDPQDLGFPSTCLDTFGQCAPISVDDFVAGGPDNDLIECIDCIIEQLFEQRT